MLWRRGNKIVRSLLVMAFIFIFAATGSGLADTPTQPTTETARSIYTSNWKDMMAIWMDSHLSQLDTGSNGPRIGEIRYSANWTVNQIVDYSAFFRDETNGVKYTQIHGFNSEGWFDSNGILNAKYLTYNGNSLSVNISRDYAMVPNQNFIIVRYMIQNPGSSAVTVNILDQLHVNNTQKANNVSINAYYDSAFNASIVNMTAAGQYYIALGALQAVDQYQVANDEISDMNNQAVAGWYTFDNNGTLKNNSSVTARDISVAFRKSLSVPAGNSSTIYFYVAVRSSLSDLQSTINTVRGGTGEYWLNQTATAYATWLNSGKRTAFADSGINTAYDRTLIAIKNSIQPVFGAMPATTNPIAYGYKIWARDSAVTAMALDASGHTVEADKYWRWLASKQNSDGSFHTCFDLWSGNYVSFVEPEHDSIGMFLIGAYRHYAITGDTAFLNDIWTAYKKAADYVTNNIVTSGFGPADSSIWEESIEYNAFTQAVYAAGLNAAQMMAAAKGYQDIADWYNGAAGTIVSAIQRNSNWNPSGLWNSAGGYYNRAVSTSGNPVTTVDSSSDALILYGVIDAASSRAQNHINKITSTLTHDTYGIARYQGDTFYYTSQWSPAGNESLAAEPSWPQMSMYVAMYEKYAGNSGTTLNSLKWYASRTAKGYMPPGEAISWVTQKPLISTMIEPITGAAFVIATLLYENQYDPRIIPSQTNAGAYKSITVHSGTTGDWPQWSDVPYYLDKTGDTLTGDSQTDIKKVYIANDANNIYLRVDNVAGTLPGYNDTKKFGLLIYSEDLKHNTAITSRSVAFYGTNLGRNMNYLAGRWSNSLDYAKFNASATSWPFNHFIIGVLAPQWDTTTGRLEALIPLSEFASSTPVSNGSWANIVITLVKQTDSATNTWVEDDSMAVHYRITGSGEAWLYGNVE